SIRWVPLTSWWSFWRAGKLTKKAIGKALETAFDLGLFDARWFLDTLEARGGQLKGTDVLSDGLTKADLTEWVKKIHQSADGTPKGIVAAIGWEKIVAQTASDTLTAVLDAFANKSGLVALATGDRKSGESVAPANTQPAGPPIISSVARDKPEKSENKKSNAPPSPANKDAKAETKKSDTGEIESHTTETEAVTDDSMIVVVDEEPEPFASVPPRAGAAAEEDEDNEATAVFTLTDEIVNPARRNK
ncbi:MAG: hypothetical protein ABI183_22540, partial [Polyangiaceae bacterium]